MSGVVLSSDDFDRMVRLAETAKAMGYILKRPMRDGGPYLVKLHGRVIYEGCDLAAIRDWLAG